MRVDDIRVFIPSKDYRTSQIFYRALGFDMEYVSEQLSIFSNGDCQFFLQRFYDPSLANNLVLQVSVLDIEEAYERLNSLQNNDIDCKFEGIKNEPWGKGIYLWGPAGELLQLTEFMAR